MDSPKLTVILPQEMFIQHLAEEGHTQAKLERKPRRNVQYKDLGECAMTSPAYSKGHC